MKILETIKVEHHTGRTSVEWRDDAGRYHVWLKENNTIENGIIYKNSHANYREEGYFDTRRLDAAAKANAETMAQIMAVVTRDDLVTKAVAAFAAEQQAERDKQEASAKLYARAKELRNGMREWINDPLKRLSEGAWFKLTTDDAAALVHAMRFNGDPE